MTSMSFDDALVELLNRIKELQIENMKENENLGGQINSFKNINIMKTKIVGRKIKWLKIESWGMICLFDGDYKKTPVFKGDIMMSNGATQPAKHSRGNIFNIESYKDSIGPYGPGYK